jgi:hypothetical protein
LRANIYAQCPDEWLHCSGFFSEFACLEYYLFYKLLLLFLQYLLFTIAGFA